MTHLTRACALMLALPAVAAAPIRAHAAPKAVIRTKSAVMGVRGLDEEDLKAALPDEAALARLKAYAATPQSLESFARFKSAALVPIAGSSTLALDPTEEKDELKLGREIAATLLGAAPLAESGPVQRYINQVGTWIALRSERPSLNWRFAVLASDAINAFAVPGGYVFVTAGLYQQLKSESQLAAVLGHEIAHVVSRDHYKVLALARSLATASSVARGMMAGLPAFKALAGLSLDHAALVFSFSLDKSAELAADQTGVMLAADSGYEPYGLPKVLEVLKLVPRSDSRAALLFKTHPTPDDRLLALDPLNSGRLASKASNPDMKDRFDEYDLAAMKLVRRGPLAE